MISRLLRYGITGVLMAGLVSCSAFPQGNSQGHGKGKGHNKHDQGDEEGQHGNYVFGVHEREVITHYYSNRGGNLPPGLERQLERNGTLPPGLQKRLEPCPVELERQLPALPAEYRRGVIGAHIVIFNKNTNVIVDILKDVAH